MKPNLQVVPSLPVDGAVLDTPPLIPPNTYRVRVIDWATCRMFGRQPKLVLRCEVCDFGKHLGVRLCRYYNVRRVGRLGRRGNFSVGWSSDLVREYARLVGMPARRDRIALSRYCKLLLLAEVETVEQSARQEPLPACAQYSVIRRFLRVEAGSNA